MRLSAGLYDAPTPATYFQRVFTDNGLNTVVADSYYDPQDSVSGDERKRPTRAASWANDAGGVGGRNQRLASAIRDRSKRRGASNSN